jgi:acetyl esterase/lipase
MNVGPSQTSHPIRLAIAGDSAGGNLACAVTVKAIQDGIRTPNGLLLIYPCLDLASTNFWRESSLAPTDYVVKAKPATGKTKQQPQQQQQQQQQVDNTLRKTEAELEMLAAHASVGPTPSATTGDAVLPYSASARHIEEYSAPQLSSRAQYTQDGVLPLKYMSVITSMLSPLFTSSSFSLRTTHTFVCCMYVCMYVCVCIYDY